MFPPKRRLSVQLSRHANFMAFLLLWPNKIPISPRSRMLTFNFNAFLTNICVGRLWNMAIYGNRLYFTVPFYTHFLFESGPFRVLSYFFAFVFIVGWECFVKNFSTRRWYPLHSVWAQLLFRLLHVSFEHSYSTHPNWDIFILDNYHCYNIFLSFRTSIQCRSCSHQYWSLSNFNGEIPIVETLSFSHYLRASVIFRAQFSVSWWQGKKINSFPAEGYKKK